MVTLAASLLSALDELLRPPAKPVMLRRNPMAKELREPKYQKRIVRDKTKYTRKGRAGKLIEQLQAMQELLLPGQTAQIKAAVAGGEKPATIARRFNISTSTVYRLAQSKAAAVITQAKTLAPPVDVAGEAFRVSTRTPKSKKLPPASDPHASANYAADEAAMRQAPESFRKNIDLIRRYHSDIPTAGLNDDAVAKAFHEHVKSNLKWLYHMQRPYRDRSKLWYEGGHKIAKDMSNEYGVSHSQAAAVIANLSPQTDWFQNVNLAKRVLDIRRDHAHKAVSDGMRGQFDRFVKTAATVSEPMKDPDGTLGKLFQKQQEKANLHAQEIAAAIHEIGDKPLNQITDPYQQAIWVRAYDEAHNSRNFPVVTPEGDFGDFVRNKGTDDRPGRPSNVAWHGFGGLTKAMAVLQKDDLAHISQQLGENHKVRNFYNNIIAPNHGHDVTIDTHAIAAAHLRPLGQTHPVVSIGLGTAGSHSDISGMGGLYGMYADAYRAAAKDLHILPRELQSITWEAVRGLFSPEQKRDKTKLVHDIENIWQAHREGKSSAATARRSILNASAPGGIRAPQWARLYPQTNVAARYAA